MTGGQYNQPTTTTTGSSSGSHYCYFDHDNNPFSKYPTTLPNQFAALPLPVVGRKTSKKEKRRAALPEILAAVERGSYEVAAAGERVVAWKVAKLALANPNARSWDAIDLHLSHSPLFYRLLHAEAEISRYSIGAFVDIWKQACLEYAPIEIFGNMLELQAIKAGKRNQYKSIFSAYPFVGFVNFTVLSIKMGDTFQFKGELRPIVDQSIRIFVITWKETCQKYSEAEVLEKMMEFYGVKKKHKCKLIAIFSSYPLVQFLSVAVASMKSGVWDSLCSLTQSTGEPERENHQADELTTSENVAVEPIKKDQGQFNVRLDSASCVDAVSIIRKVLDYLAENLVVSFGSSHLDKVLTIVNQLCHCKVWLAKQFSVDEFESLGHGDLLSFLERNTSVLQKELLKSVEGKKPGDELLEARMVQHQLVMLLSQASTSLWENNNVTAEKISELLKRQFPYISFKSFESGEIDGHKELLNTVRLCRSDATFNNLFYSAALLGTSDYANCVGANDPNDSVIANVDHTSPNLGSVTSRDAVEALLKAPFLVDLSRWSRWDVSYAPSLGPFLDWLVTETDAKALTCLLTRDGKIVRIDHLASVDMFLEALIQEIPSQVAVQLLSLFALSGGRRHAPLSLLKCQAQRGFQVIVANSVQSGSKDGQICEKVFTEHEATDCTSNTYLVNNVKGVEKSLRLISRIIIDCLASLPSEFRCFAADVLVSGSQSLFKDVTAAALLQCVSVEERLMLREVGLSLGIIDWINDHSSLCSAMEKGAVISERTASSLFSASPDVKTLDCTKSQSKDGLPFSASVNESKCILKTDVTSAVRVPEVDTVENIISPHLTDQSSKEQDAALVIDSIRREEFGLDPNNSDVDNSLLKKQHARLGRALHCLSQGLYSQDSHFLLELVQNADDNAYPENIEPTLVFILTGTSIIVLNNERGFTAENIRALCDVGNSTKKGSSAGYIGEKGIGFKSVFRVTDAPEIHSNGFHVKFSISADQIGFVLPTVVPPCNIDMFDRLLSEGEVQQCWNTCILLPFNSKLSEDSAASSILYMFSDLQPSLLLFLHRVQCIRLRNMLDNSDIVMRKEILGDGIVKMSHGNEKTTWFVSSKRLHPRINRSNVPVSEISLAMMLKETENGEYRPSLQQQPVYAFLPLRTYGLKFIIQADFVLPSSREEVDVDSPWNQWLLSEFPDVFVDAEKSLSSLPCFKENPAKAVSVFMSFVPLIGEVHGFFSGLPRMIISKLRQANCVLQDGCNNNWVPPCKVLRSWNDQARILLPDALLYEHLGLVLLHKDIDLPDAVSRALGIEEYGLKTLVQFMTSLGRTKDGIKSMGLGWVLQWLHELHNMFLSYAPNSNDSRSELELINILKKVPFIPLSDGTYAASDYGTIWLHDRVRSEIYVEVGAAAFPHMYSKLRSVNPALFSETNDAAVIIICTRMLQKIGVRLMSGHELIKFHILPSISDNNLTEDKQLMTDYMAYIMFHLQSNCADCHVEGADIISELRDKALILTNYGYKRSAEVPIHFDREFGNSVDVSKFIKGLDYRWHEVDTTYLNHPVTKLISCGLMRWREFFLKLGVTDFVKTITCEKSIADISTNQMMCDRHLLSPGLVVEDWESLVSPGLVVEDWESEELVHILTLLSKHGDQKRCIYLTEVLDAVWDDSFSDKVFGRCSSIAASNNFFKSSLLTSLSDIKWVASSTDSDLHHPSELFDECYEVQSILGSHAPYAVPKIKSTALIRELGLKTEVMLDDALAVLHTWTTSKPPFKARMSQLSNFYMFIWKKMASSRQPIVDAFSSAACIFVPCASTKLQEDYAIGVFQSPAELYWHDPTGALGHIQSVKSRMLSKGKKKSRSVSKTVTNLSTTLCSVYPGLHDFFVVECGVHGVPPFHHYPRILQQLSENALPAEAAKMVFQVLLRWSDGIKSGALGPNDTSYFKECLSHFEFAVLPAMGNKWVSSHSSFGLLCWCDDENLKKEFDHSDDLVFLHFGDLSESENEMLHTRVSELLQLLDIPSFSKIVSREPIYLNPTGPCIITSMVEWVLPFAQYYLYNLHPDKYSQLSRLGFAEIQQLRVVEVEKLFYCNVIKKLNRTSRRQFESSSLLQGSVLYATQSSDSHSVFMELSRLFFDGVPNIHLANFLHMITIRAESGSTNEQIELFILTSQNMSKLPDEERVWCLFSPPSLQSQKAESLVQSFMPTNISEPGDSSNIKIPTYPSGNVVGVSEGIEHHEAHGGSVERNTRVAESDTISPVLHTTPESSTNPLVDTSGIVADFCREEGQVKGSPKDKAARKQAMETGKLGELLAFKYFIEKAGGPVVNWVNQKKETGLPYDIVLGEDDTREYLEVKTSRFARKDWFEISTREWQFAAEKGDAYSIVHVKLCGENMSRIIVHKNPAKLCQEGKLQLAVMTPRWC